MASPSLRESFRLIHRPESERDWQRAQRRFRFEEAYVLQVVLALRRAAARGLEATPRVARPGGLVAGVRRAAAVHPDRRPASRSGEV